MISTAEYSISFDHSNIKTVQKENKKEKIPREKNSSGIMNE
jgi:hypothetical protein